MLIVTESQCDVAGKGERTPARRARNQGSWSAKVVLPPWKATRSVDSPRAFFGPSSTSCLRSAAANDLNANEERTVLGAALLLLLLLEGPAATAALTGMGCVVAVVKSLFGGRNENGFGKHIDGDDCWSRTITQRRLDDDEAKILNLL